PADLRSFPTRRSSDLKQRPDIRAPLAAFVATGDPVAGVLARQTRSGCGADLFIYSHPSGNRKTKCRTRGKNPENATTGFARDLRDRKSTRLNSSHVAI